MNQDLKIFLLIGQSNMSGRGELQEVSSIQNSQIFMYRDSEWKIAEEPLHQDNPKITGVGLAMSFAVELLKSQPDAKIGLVPCAVGWTALSQWMPGGVLYENAVSTTLKAKSNGVLDCILWHQGENDSCHIDEAKSYGKRLKKMIDSLRSDLNIASVPLLAGALGNYLKEMNDFKYFNLVNKQLLELEKFVLNYGCVSADGLTCKSDGLHFDSKSLREFGIRYARKYLESI